MDAEIQKWIRRKKKASNEGNLEQLSHACSKLAELYTKTSCYAEALAEYKQEATVYEAQGNKIKLAVANRMIGEVFSSMEDYEKALKHQVKHLELAREEGSEVEEQRALATIGRTYFCQAESSSSDRDEYKILLTNAKNAYKKSLTLCERLTGIGKTEHAQMRARLLLNIGLVQECQDEIEKAVGNIQNAIQFCKEHDLFEDLFRCYSSLGMLYYRHKNSSKALNLLELALNVAGRLEEKVELSCETLLNKAEVLFSLPDFQRAKQVLRQAYKLKTPIETDRKSVEKNLKLVIAMCNAQDQLLQISETDFVAKKKLFETIGDGCVAVKNYKTALEYYHKMLEMSEALGDTNKHLAAVYVSLSQTYKDNGQYSEALKYFKKELELWKENPSEACNTTLNIGEVLEIRGSCYEELEETYNNARELARKACNHKQELLSVEALYNIQKLKGRFELAAESEKELQILRDICGEDETSSEEESTPDIGDDICLETYSFSDTDEEEYDRPRRDRKRPRRLIIRRNEKGETQLHVACINGNLNLAKRLIEQGHPVNERDHCGWLPLHEASNHGYHELVELLLDNGATINDPGGLQCGGVTPLHDAASCGHLAVVELLLDRGASVSIRTDEGDTPLDCLVKWHDRTKPKYDPIEQTFYQEIYSRLKSSLQKAGLNMVIESTQRKQKSCQNSLITRKGHEISISNNKKSVSSQNLRRILEDSESEGEKDALEVSSISSSGSLSPVNQNRSRHTSPNAAREYQDVMTMLRTKDKQLKTSAIRTKPKDQRAFLTEEDVGEDWLEEDITLNTRPKKKQRRSSPVEKQRQGLVTGFTRKSSGMEIQDEPSDEEMFVDQHPQLTIIQQNNKSRGLLDDFVEILPKEVQPNKEVKSSNNRSSEVPSYQSVRVRVEDKLLLIPVQKPEEHTIGWLALEAARRFSNMEGLHPTLKLLTNDGAILSDDDPISLVCNEEIVSEVTSWNIPPLTNRYLESCKTLHVKPDDVIYIQLEACQATNSLHLSDLALTTTQLAPLFRAINRQHTLQELLLSGNFIGDEGLKLFSAALPTLCQLRVLDLSCNDISANGIQQVNSSLNSASTPVLPMLSHLVLSHNPLGNACIKSLCLILSKLSSLTSLSLQNCSFTNVSFPTQTHWPLQSLSEFDISYNTLGGACISSLLVHLTPTKLETLNLAASETKPSTSVIQEVVSFLSRVQEHPTLKVLDVSDCDVTDEDVQSLLRELVRCPAFRSLRMESNKKLTSISLRRIVQHQPPIHSVELAGCCNIDSYLHDSSSRYWMAMQGSAMVENLRLNSSARSEEEISSMWREAWGQRAKILKSPAGLLTLCLKR
ncbi:Tonsoku-like protein [Blattella germanica]|nr:Tonsoku-like protein [Blattella germanica]